MNPGARPKLLAAIVRRLTEGRDLQDGERLFRRFVACLNLVGAGIVFEAWSNVRIDQFVFQCDDKARGDLAD